MAASDQGKDYRAQLRAMMGGRLDPADFGHLDHLGIAYEAIASHDFFEALWLVSKGLRDVAQRAQVPDKFNATVTFAFMSLMAERMQRSPYESFGEFLSRNSDLTSPSVLAPWYSAAHLNTPLARAVPLMPRV